MRSPDIATFQWTRADEIDQPISAQNHLLDMIDHTVFIKPMQAKWNKAAPGKFPPLTPRATAFPEFHPSVFTSPKKYLPEDWPSPEIAKLFQKMDCSNLPLSDLPRSIVGGAKAIKGDINGLKCSLENMTVGGAEDILSEVRGMMDRGELSN